MKRAAPWRLPAALLLAGCPSPAPIEDAGDNDASIMDAMVGMDAARDTGVRTDSAAARPTGQSTCSGRCVDTPSGRANRGAWGSMRAAGEVRSMGAATYGARVQLRRDARRAAGVLHADAVTS